MVSQLVLKSVISGVLVAAASELARRSPTAGAIMISLPLTSILALIWLWRDTGDAAQVTSLSWSILFVIAPSIVIFIALPLLLRAGVNFWIALPTSCVIMAATYAVYAWGMSKCGYGI